MHRPSLYGGSSVVRGLKSKTIRPLVQDHDDQATTAGLQGHYVSNLPLNNTDHKITSLRDHDYSVTAATVCSMEDRTTVGEINVSHMAMVP
ncbi:hypothetical protein TNCV_2419381 [Trichonephila clavipes]|nr:hypothetical protein TNCV_2419381 [Trichonephila clavipes]